MFCCYGDELNLSKFVMNNILVDLKTKKKKKGMSLLLELF